MLNTKNHHIMMIKIHAEHTQSIAQLLCFLGFIITLSCSGGDDSQPNPANQPPDNFALLEVRNNAVDVSLNPTLSWGRATDPDGDNVTYQVLLDEGAGNPSAVIVSNLKLTEYMITTSLEQNALYSWQVVASDGNGGSKSSEVFTFTTRDNLPPENFNLLQVVNNEVDIDLKPLLTWENAVDPDGDQVTYDLVLDSGDENPSTLIASDLQSTSFELLNDLDYSTLHSWKVIARDSKGNATESEVFKFTTRGLRFQETTSDAGFEGREWFNLIRFNDRFWVIDGAMLGDVWSSSDGINWAEETVANGFSARFGHTSVVFNGKIWVIGGAGFSGTLNDVWSSSDGVNWVQETANANFTKRYLHTTVVFNNKMWLIGGEDGTYEDNEVWSSSDGINWNLEVANPPFLARFGHSSVVFNNRIWIIAGLNSVQGGGAGELNDVWSSDDGVNWQVATVDADFSVRFNHSSVIYKDKMWVIAGSANDLNEIWMSSDGIQWKEEVTDPAFPGRMGHSSLVFDNKVWITSGWSSGSLINDVWFFD